MLIRLNAYLSAVCSDLSTTLRRFLTTQRTVLKNDASKKQWSSFIIWATAQACIILAILWCVLGIGVADLTVPFNYWGDTLWFLVPIKSLIDTGNPYFVPLLSAPFELSAAAFPSMTNFDWAVMKLMSSLTDGPGHLLNWFWLTTIVVTGWLSAYSLQLLNVRRGWLCFMFGMAYALLPFAFMRNVAHISLVYYAVAPICVLAVHLAMGFPAGTKRAVLFAGFFAIFVQGFGYIYYSFFAALLLGFAAIVGYFKTLERKPLVVGAVAILILTATSSINLMPSFWSWATLGKPDSLNYKSAAEAEDFGLKLRRLVAPHEANALPILSSWGKSDAHANFPLENENVTARLGTLGALGLGVLLIRILVPQVFRGAPVKLDALATLTLFCLLFTTVGGLGALFNQIIPDIRAYNRFSVFIAFLSLAAVAVWIEMLFDNARSLARKVGLFVAVLSMFLTSIYDQTLDARPLVSRRAADEAAAHHERDFVRLLAKFLPVNSAVFQLPVTGFPPDGGRVRMLTYDHARPYLASTTLRWSWPSFSKRHRQWEISLEGLTGKELITRLLLSGFRAVWIDTYGYIDQGEKIIAELRHAGGVQILDGISQRYVVIDLADADTNLRNAWSAEEFDARREFVLTEPEVNWRSGFYESEVNSAGMSFRWSRSQSHLELKNWTSKIWKGKIEFEVVTEHHGRIYLSATDLSALAFDVGAKPTQISLPITISPNATMELVLSSNAGRITLPPGEVRDLHFQLQALRFEKD